MRLNAPPDFNWTDSDVRFEKTDSWYSGFLVGLVSGVVLILVVVVICA